MSASDKDPVRLQRANFVVSNLETSYRLYRDVLGFEIAFEKTSEPDSYSYPVFGIGKTHKLRFAILSTARQPRILALTEVSEPTLDAAALPRRSAIVLDVADVDAVVAGARGLGLTVHPEDRLETHDGRVGREVGIVDADGNLVVIYSIETG